MAYRPPVSMFRRRRIRASTRAGRFLASAIASTKMTAAVAALPSETAPQSETALSICNAGMTGVQTHQTISTIATIEAKRKRCST